VELAQACWNMCLYQIQSEKGKKVSAEHEYAEGSFKFGEIRFKDFSKWVFARKISINGIKGWQLEDDVNKEPEREPLFFNNTEEVFTYLEKVNSIFMEKISDGQYMVKNKDTKEDFLLLEERKPFFCSCSPSDAVYYEFYNPSAPFVIPEQTTGCCRPNIPEIRFYRPTGTSLMACIPNCCVCCSCCQGRKLDDKIENSILDTTICMDSLFHSFCFFSSFFFLLLSSFFFLLLLSSSFFFFLLLSSLTASSSFSSSSIF
jgi:hypothetical protein